MPDETDPSSPRTRRGPKVAAACALVVVVAALAPPVRATLRQPTPGYDVPAAAVVLSYRCSSSLIETDETYTFTASVPAEVEQGSEFTLSDVVITGTPSVDLLLVSLTVDLVAPIGATSMDGLSRTFLGPGSQTPPGPVAEAGSPNSSPAMSFGFVASGPVGTTIDFHTGTVSSVVAEIGNPTNTVPVTCSRTGGGAIASTTIVAPPDTTTTTAGGTASDTGSVPDPGTGPDAGPGVAVLGATQSPAGSVSVTPSYTG